MITVQKISKNLKDNLEVAIKYYSILNIINDLKLTQMELRLISFTAVKGNLASGGAANIFMELFSYKKQSINNSISKLYTQNIFLKKEGKIKVNPVFLLDFNNPLILQIKISGKAENT